MRRCSVMQRAPQSGAAAIAAAAMTLSVPAATAAECRRVAAQPQPWIVADMDSTILRKSPGEWPGLDDSPCRAPLFTWLESGGRLLVVTSDDGQRPWRSLMRLIPAPLRAGVVLSTADGACLSSQVGPCDEFVEEEDYWRCALASEGLRSTGLPSAAQSVEIACELKRDFLVDCMTRPELLATVSPDWRMEGYKAIVEKFATAAELREYLTTDQMLGMNALMPRGSLVWRNQAGTPDFWHVSDDEEYRKLRNAKLKEGLATAAAGEPEPEHGPRWTNCFVLGMRSEISEPYVVKHTAALEEVGAVATRAPNSVLIKSRHMNKGVPVRYLERMGRLDLSSALAFGDNPSGNDGPLAEFGEAGMPFVSVAPTVDECPEHLRYMHVGGLEKGTAACLELMNEARIAAGLLPSRGTHSL